MADVGVLNLQIQDNSAKAKTGLDALAGALSKIKEIVGTSLGLSAVNTELKTFAQTINRQTVTMRVIKDLTAFGNAIEKLSKLKGALDFNVEPIANLKKAIGDGIKITGNPAGQIERIRAAMTADWSADVAVQGMKDLKARADAFEKSGTAQTIRDVGNALSTFAKGANAAQSSLAGMNGNFEALGRFSAEGFANGILSGTQEVINAAKQMAKSALEATAQEQDSHSPSVEFEKLGKDAGQGYVNGIRDKLNDAGNAGKELAQQAMHDAGAFGDVKTTPLYGLGAMNTEPMYGLGDMNTEPIQASIEQWFDFAEAVEQGQETLWNCNEAVVQMDDSIGVIKSRTAEASDAFKDLGSTTTEVITQLEDVTTTTEPINTSLNTVASTATSVVTSLASAASSLSSVASTIQTAVTSMQTAMSTMPDTSVITSNITQPLSTANSTVQTANSAFTNLGNTMNTTSTVANTVADSLGDVDKELKQKKRDAKDASSGIEIFKKTLNGLKKAFPGVFKMFGMFKNILKRMVIRSIIRQIGDAFSEGVQNVYQYSKAVGTAFAPAMDEAATSLQLMKNSIGAAVSPLIQSLIPVLQSVVNWFIQGINYVNQFFALLRGQKTWTRALPATTTAFKNQEKAAKGAAAAIKDLLADWDELNIIQSETSGAGGGIGTDAAANYLEMFEEVDRYDDGVVKAVDYVKEHFQDIINLIKTAGALILAWKVSKAFGDSLNSLKNFTAGATLMITGLTVSSLAGESAGSKGYFDQADTIAAIGGALAAGIGGALIGAEVGGPWGAGIGFVVGVGLSVLATFTSFNIANKERIKEGNWGYSNFTKEEIQSYIQSQFTFDIEAQINNIGVITDNREGNRTQLQKDINEFTSTLKLAKIRVGISAANTSTAMDELNDSVDAVIKSWHKQHEDHLPLLYASLELLPMGGTNGSDAPMEDVINTLKIGGKSLTDYMTDLGKKVADAYNAGLKAEWGNGTYEAYIQQVEKLNRIVQNQQEYKKQQDRKQLEIEKELIFENLDYEDAKTAFDAFEEWKNKYQNTVMAELQSRLAGNVEEAGAQRAVLDELNREADEQGLVGAAREAYLNSKGYTKIESSLKELEKLIEEDQKALADFDTYLKTSDAMEEYRKSLEGFNEEWLKLVRMHEMPNLFEMKGGNIFSDFFESEQIIQNMNALIREYADKGEKADLSGMFVNMMNNGSWSWGYTPLAAQILNSIGKTGLEGLSDEAIELLIGQMKSYITMTNQDVDPEDFIRQLFSRVIGGGRVIDILDNMEQATVDVPVTINIEPEVTADTLSLGEKTDAAMNYLKQSILRGFNIDNMLSIYQDIQRLYGSDTLDMVFSKLWEMPEFDGVNLNEYEMSIRRQLNNPSSGAYPTTPSFSGETFEEDSMAGAVAKGMNQSNTPTQDQANEIIGLLSQWLNKDFNFTVSPSSGWAMHNEKSRSQFERVNG